MNKFFPFKKMFWSYTFCAIPFALLASILALFNVMPVYFNESPHYGIKGFIIPIVFIPFVGLLFSITNWLALNFGSILYNAFLKFLNRNS
jgi:hypothetical protein